MHLPLHTLSVPLLAALACTGAWAQGATPPPALFAPSPPALTAPSAPAPAASAVASPVSLPAPPAATAVPNLLGPSRPSSAPSQPAAAKPAPAASTIRIVMPQPAPRKVEPPKAAPATQAPELKPLAVQRGRTEAPLLNPAARASVDEAQHFANNPAVMPVIGKGGKLIFAFGDAVPTVVCAPLKVCDVELEPGENIQGAPHIGDSVRWRISPAVSYEGDQRVIHLIIKATAADLDTNLIVPTDRRTYYLRLVSSEDRYVSRVAFEYPEDTKAWLKVQPPPPVPVKPGAAAAVAAPAIAAVPVDDLPAVAIGKLRFDYQVTVAAGSPKFVPVRVMDDGARVFITMADNMAVDEAPVLFLIGADGSEQLVNYRLRGNIFIIDRLADKIALVSGSGSARQRVDISRGICDRSGWFHKCITPATPGGPGS